MIALLLLLSSLLSHCFPLCLDGKSLLIITVATLTEMSLCLSPGVGRHALLQGTIAKHGHTPTELQATKMDSNVVLLAFPSLWFLQRRNDEFETDQLPNDIAGCVSCVCPHGVFKVCA